MLTARFNSGSLVGMRMYAQQTEAVNRSLHRLATGKRINRAADDPSGLIAAENLAARSGAIRTQIRSLERSQLHAAAKEGALSVISDMLVELEALTVTAANTGATSTEERDALQLEADGIIEGIDHILSTSRFNGELLFEGQNATSLGGVTGSLVSGGPTEQFDLSDLKTGESLNLVDGNHSLAQSLAEAVAGATAESRSALGALQKNYYDREISVLNRELESLADAESIIRDTDFAREVTELVRSQILQEAALRTILIAGNQHRTATLSLLTVGN